jgi:integrase
VRQRGAILPPRGARKTYSVKYRTATGKQVFKGGFATKTKASEYLKDMVEKIDRGVYVERTPITFEKFSEQWLTGRRKIRGSTESGYGSIIRAQLVPRFGTVRLSDLQLEHLQQAVSGMIEDELSAKTIHNAATLLRTMLAGSSGASAQRRGWIGADPTLGLELPALETKEIIPPSPEQAWKLIEAAREIGGISYGLTFLGAFTGLRRNEVLAVQFGDVDWFNRELRVQHAISKRKGTDGAHKWEWWVGPPKSKKSVRRLHLTESAIKLLADLKSLASKGDGFVFAGAKGEFIDPDKFDAEVWSAVTGRAEMPGTRFHDLRHFFASQLIAQGETPAHVRDQMGHSSINVTFDTYGHLFPGSGSQAARRFEESMKKARTKADPNGSNLVAIAADISSEQMAAVNEKLPVKN